MSLVEVRKYAEAKLRKYGLKQNWKFEYTNKDGRTLGLCNYRERKIILNAPWVKREGGLSVEVKDTILHEIAHALTPGAGHGKVWRRAAVMVGARPRATKPMNTVKTKQHLWEARFGDRVVGKWFKRPTKIEKMILRGSAYLPDCKEASIGKIVLYKIDNGRAVKWASTSKDYMEKYLAVAA